MRKSFLLSLCLLATALIINAQQDPEAKKILDRVAEKSKHYTTIETDFSLSIVNRREDFSSTSDGKLKIKGNKYYMESTDTKVYFDGKTLWTYMEDINEVTITEPDIESDDFVENPLAIFELYSSDFKFRLLGEVKLDIGWVYEIDLFPKNLEQPYSRFKVYIRKDSEDIYMIKAVGKDGVDYTAYLKNPKYNQSMDDSLFTFSEKDHKGVDVVDMRF
jgi:outer membrane lipoprotein-sorting protein